MQRCLAKSREKTSIALYASGSHCKVGAINARLVNQFPLVCNFHAFKGDKDATIFRRLVIVVRNSGNYGSNVFFRFNAFARLAGFNLHRAEKFSMREPLQKNSKSIVSNDEL